MTYFCVTSKAPPLYDDGHYYDNIDDLASSVSVPDLQAKSRLLRVLSISSSRVIVSNSTQRVTPRRIKSRLWSRSEKPPTRVASCRRREKPPAPPIRRTQSASALPRPHAGMSIHEDSGGLPASSESFWELGQYKRTVKRVDDGARLCADLSSLIKERGDIEAAYAKSLRGWGKKWQDQIEKGPEYGTLETAWMGVLEEAERRADMHTRVKDRLNEEVVATIKTWLKSHFHHKPLTGLKEAKDLDEDFRKVQKPWAKLYAKVKKARSDYHSACKTEKSALNNEKNAQSDTGVSIDAQKKLVEKVDRCREEKDKAREAYEGALKEMNRNNSKYMEDMEMVFDKAQTMEEERHKFFKEMLFGIHKCLDISQDPKLREIYERYWAVLETAEARRDLELWHQQHGPGMPMNWPVFEDYAEDFRLISAAESKGSRGHIAAATIVLKGVKADRFQSEFAEYSPELRKINKSRDKDLEVNAGMVMLIGKRANPEASPTSSLATQSSGGSTGAGGGVVLRNGGSESGPPPQTRESRVGSQHSPSPFENDWDAPAEAAPPPHLVDDGQPGLKVVALYDYEALEEDELPLKKGEEFEKLEEEDEQGWCKGRKGGRVGLYPANYATPVAS